MNEPPYEFFGADIDFTNLRMTIHFIASVAMWQFCSFSGAQPMAVGSGNGGGQPSESTLYGLDGMAHLTRGTRSGCFAFRLVILTPSSAT